MAVLRPRIRKQPVRAAQAGRVVPTARRTAQADRVVPRARRTAQADRVVPIARRTRQQRRVQQPPVTEKLCRKCNQTKPLNIDYFPRCNRNKNGFKSNCKDCINGYHRDWNKTPAAMAMKESAREANRKSWRKYNRSDKGRRRIKKCHKSNRFLAHMRHRWLTEPEKRALSNTRRNLHRLLAKLRANKPAHTEEILAIDGRAYVEYLNKKARLLGMRHIEFLNREQVKNNRRLQEMGILQIDVDHIIPCDAFDPLDPDHIYVCYHYTNTQLLPHHTNQSKSASLPENFDIDEHVETMLNYFKEIDDGKKTWQDVLDDQVNGDIFGFVTRRNRWYK